MSIFQELYDSKINFSISCPVDGGFEVKLGDSLKGRTARTRVESWDEIEQWLRAEALLHYPESQFSKVTLATI